MKNLVLVTIAALSLAACQKAEEATVVEAVPTAEATEGADAPAVEMPAEEKTEAKN